MRNMQEEWRLQVHRSDRLKSQLDYTSFNIILTHNFQWTLYLKDTGNWCVLIIDSFDTPKFPATKSNRLQHKVRGLLEKYPTFGREKETGLLGALDT